MYSNIFLFQIGLFIALMSLMQGMKHLVRGSFDSGVDNIRGTLKRIVIASYCQRVNIWYWRLLMIVFLGLSMAALYGLSVPTPNFMSALSIRSIQMIVVIHFSVCILLLEAMLRRVEMFWSKLNWAIGIDRRTNAFYGRIIQIKEPEEKGANGSLILTIQDAGKSDVKLLLTKQTREEYGLDWLAVGVSVTVFYRDQQTWTQATDKAIDKAVAFMAP